MDRVAREALEQLLDLPDVCRVGLALTEGGGRRLQFTASDRDPSQGVAWCHIDAYDDVPLTTTVRTGEPVVGGLDDLDERYAELVARQRSTGVVAIAAVPLIGTGPPAGGLVLFYDAPQDFDDAHRGDLQRRASELAVRLRRLQGGAPRHGPGLRDQPVGPGVEVSDLDVEAHPSAVGETRRHLRRTLRAWGVDEDVVDTAVLCLSEIVTNAIVHTGAGAELRATLDQGLLTVTVRDRGRHADERSLDRDRRTSRTPCGCTDAASRCSTPSPTGGGPSSTRSAPPCGSCSRPERGRSGRAGPRIIPGPVPGRVPRSGMRVLFATTGGIGHFGPLVPFARACLDAGHEVVVAAPTSFADQVGRAGLAHAPIGEPPAEVLGRVFAGLRRCRAPRPRTSWCARSSVDWTPGPRCPGSRPWSATGSRTSWCASRPRSPRSSPRWPPGCRTPRWRSA